LYSFFLSFSYHPLFNPSKVWEPIFHPKQPSAYRSNICLVHQLPAWMIYTSHLPASTSYLPWSTGHLCGSISHLPGSIVYLDIPATCLSPAWVLRLISPNELWG
jgi:hypothetical protein